MANLRLSTRHRFNNRLSFILTATTLVLLGVISIIYGDNCPTKSSGSSSFSSLSNQSDAYGSARFLEDADGNGNDDDGNNSDDYSRYSCRYIYDQVSEPQDLCNYAKTCNEGEGVWAPWVFCSSSMSVYTAFAILSPVAILWMVTLFRLLGSTAEDFFSCSLEMFSVKLGLPPRFAGVTLLALGNGAADVSATISAIVSDEENGYKLSLGALTGAAMLVGGVVSGVVVIVADGVKCRGALIRDVMALFVTVIIVWIYLSGGVVTHATTSVFFGLYGSFVCVVLAADIYHRVVVLPRMQAVESAVADAEQRAAGSGEGLGNNVDGAISMGQSPPNAFMQMVTSFSNYDNANLTAAATQQQQVVGDGINQPPETSPSTLESQVEPTGEADLVANEGPFVLHGQNGILSENNHSHAFPSSNLEMDADDGGGNYTLVEDHIDRVCVGEGSPGTPSYNWIGAYHDGKQEISSELSELWNEISSSDGELKKHERFLLLCEFPFTVLRKVSPIQLPFCLQSNVPEYTMHNEWQSHLYFLF